VAHPQQQPLPPLLQLVQVLVVEDLVLPVDF
jgi:hypothetical protein